jgi:hypothetical protein
MNHGNRALLVMLLANADLHPTTIMGHLHHNNVASQLPYVRRSDAIEHSVQNALVPTFVAPVSHAASNISCTVDKPKVRSSVAINWLLVLLFTT